MTAEAGTAWATVVLDLITLLAVVAAFYGARFAKQSIDSARDENRKWNTLRICSELELNSCVSSAEADIVPILFDQAKDEDQCKRVRRAAMIVLNFLDGIAIGVHQGLYIESLAKDHLEHIVRDRVDKLIHTGFAEKAGISRSWWPHLCEMAAQWNKNETYYKDASR